MSVETSINDNKIQWKCTANKNSFNVRKGLLTVCEVYTGKYSPEVSENTFQILSHIQIRGVHTQPEPDPDPNPNSTRPDSRVRSG